MATQKPRCILLTGPLGAGKSTISALYGGEHPLTLLVHTDELMGMVSGWLEHEELALQMTFQFALDMTRRHLRGGHDVMLPYFVHTPEEIAAIAKIAEETGAEFHAFLLHISKELSVQRTLERGSWGEPGSPPVTEADTPIIEAKYDELMAAVADYPGLHRFETTACTVDETYTQLMHTLTG
ncbi:hypothetical protein EYC59_05845 [Candidatus Saccharibacteria bacterium]|nr:MAG: hypothetical protein EYC59_05845 [Candidatus Saccharibacteria bacterium]